MINKLISEINTLLMLNRGYCNKIWFKKSNGKIKIGRHTKIKHKHNIITGNNVLIKDYVEIIATSNVGVIMGDNVTLGKYSIIKSDFNSINTGFIVGNNFGCGDFCFFGCAGGIRIGNDVIMGQNVRFHAQNHNFDRIDIPIRKQGTTQKGIVIEDDCWIGAGSVILDGVTIGKGSVIGANSVVNKNIEPYSVAVGNPVKVIKNRQN